MSGAGGLERTRYSSGQVLSADDLGQEQDYFREKLRRHNRVLHGWGIVSGLETGVDGDRTLTVSPGYALDQLGDEIVVQAECSIDVCDLAEGATAFLAVRYVEQPTRPVPALGGDEGEMAFSRTREGFELGVHPTCPAEPWVVLADFEIREGKVAQPVGASHRRHVGRLGVSSSAREALPQAVELEGEEELGDPA